MKKFKTVETQRKLYENAVVKPLETGELNDVNGGWCIILVCTGFLGTIIIKGPQPPIDPDKPLPKPPIA